MRVISGAIALKSALALALFLPALGTNAATITASSLTASAVQAAISSASAGDTITVPSGTATWSSGVSVNKPVTVQGAGIGVTTITSSGGDVFSLQASSKTMPTRITGMTISGGTVARGVIVDNSGLSEFGLFRVDHCRILNGYMEGINVDGFMNGVIDHCQIEDCYLEIGMYPNGNMDHSWQLPLVVGSTNCTVVEDCVFLKTAGGWHPFQGSFENGHGARLVFRYNRWTNFWSSSMQPCFDAHGNQGAVDTNLNVLVASGGVRGNRQLEMYGNIFNGVGAGGVKVYYRGGVLITFSNQWIGGWDSGFKVNEEDGTSRFNLLGGYPGYDQHWMWTWGNTPNVSSWYSGLPGNDSAFLLTGVNVFWGVPPSPSAPGYPVASPPITSYTPLVYPHPLVTAQGGGGTLGNLPPTAVVTSNPNPPSGVKPLTVNFTGSGSSDPEGSPLTYAWTFGDGRTSTNANPSITYSNVGSYTAQLTVSDRTNTASTSVQVTVLANSSGLVAAYGFEEGSGTAVVDSSGNGNAGVVTSAGWSPAGRFGRAMAFGSSSLVAVPEAAMLDMAGAVTIEAWVNPNSAGTNWQNVILKGGPNTALSYILNAVGMPSLSSSFFVSAAPAGVFSPAPLPINTWTHLCGTYDGSAMRIYTNGVLAGTLAQTGAISASSDGLFIGGNPYYGHNFTGLIDEVRIYNRALSAVEIQTDMNSPIIPVSRPPPPVNLHVVTQ